MKSMRVLGSAIVSNSTTFFSSSATLNFPLRHLSLSELAKAFEELSDSGVVVGGGGGGSTKVSRTSIDRGQYQTEVKIKDNNISDNFISSKDIMNKKNLEVNYKNKNNISNHNLGVVTFSHTYSDSLMHMSGTQLTLELESECKRLHHGHMLQCLVEVWRRLREIPPTEIIISDEEARGEINKKYDSIINNFSIINTSVTSPLGHFRTDALLEAVLRALAKTNIEGVQSNYTADDLGGNISNKNSYEWLSEFCYLILQWLTVRASSINASRSANFLHLLSQQKAIHCDSVLETLRDNIEVFLLNYPLDNSTSYKESSSEYIPSKNLVKSNNINNFELSNFSALLDSIARWQLGFIRLIALGNAIHTTSFSSSSSSSYFTLEENTGMAMKTVALLRHEHPILNPRFFEIITSALLRGVREGALHLSRHNSPTSFFFLTLALAKIHWFNLECVEVLLPQLHEGLRTFPGQFLGVLLLLGRREVQFCGVATANLLIQIILDAMRRRGRQYNNIDGRRRHRVDIAALTISQVDEKNNVGSESEVEVDANINNNNNNKNESNNNNKEEEEDDDDLQLFSTSISPSVYTENETIQPMEVFTMSFVDLRSMPLFLDSLHHILSITRKYCDVKNLISERNAIDIKANTLYELLLNDTHAGVKSISSLLERPGLLEKLLVSVLHIPRETHHPFLIELTYAFTIHIGSKRKFLNNNRNNSKNSLLPIQKRIINIIEMLLHSGLILPDVYVMSDEIIQSAPRVAVAVEEEKKRLLQRLQERQDNRIRIKEKKTIKTSSVFIKFSRVVKELIQLQQYRHH